MANVDDILGIHSIVTKMKKIRSSAGVKQNES
jgi:hypothetical protein